MHYEVNDSYRARNLPVQTSIASPMCNSIIILHREELRAVLAGSPLTHQLHTGSSGLQYGSCLMSYSSPVTHSEMRIKKETQ